MPTFLQPVAIPERCFLQEVLHWVAFQRLPITQYDADGVELHDSTEIFEENSIFPEHLDEFYSEEECERAGIPPDPRFQAVLADEWLLAPSEYKKFLAHSGLSEADRAKFTLEHQQAVEFQAKCKAWKTLFDQSIEYPVSRIFVGLKEGSLSAWGRKLPSVDLRKAEAKLERGGERACDLPRDPIPPKFWSLQGIDFERSTARNSIERYCHIVCSTSEILAAFPGDRQPISGVERVGDSYLVSDAQPISDAPRKALRGRPSYPWEGFHLAVAELVKDGSLPQKKEAAIQQMQDWFVREHGQKPSRAAVGERLTPYYSKFVRTADRK